MTARWLPWLALAAAALVLVACATENRPESTDSTGGGGSSSVVSQGGGGEAAAPGLIIGTGQQSLEPWPEDGEVSLHRGCQGLQHIYVSVVSDVLGQSRWLVNLSLVRAQDGDVVSIPYEVLLRPDRVGAGLWGIVGLNLVVPYPDDALDRSLVLEATVDDEEGRRVAGSVDVRIVWGADHCGGH